METSLITGWLPALLTVVGIAALVGLIVLPPHKNWWLRGLAVVAATGVVVVAIDLFITLVWRPFSRTSFRWPCSCGRGLAWPGPGWRSPTW